MFKRLLSILILSILIFTTVTPVLANGAGIPTDPPDIGGEGELGTIEALQADCGNIGLAGNEQVLNNSTEQYNVLGLGFTCIPSINNYINANPGSTISTVWTIVTDPGFRSELVHNVDGAIDMNFISFSLPEETLPIKETITVSLVVDGDTDNPIGTSSLDVAVCSDLGACVDPATLPDYEPPVTVLITDACSADDFVVTTTPNPILATTEVTPETLIFTITITNQACIDHINANFPTDNGLKINFLQSDEIGYFNLEPLPLNLNQFEFNLNDLLGTDPKVLLEGDFVPVFEFGQVVASNIEPDDKITFTHPITVCPSTGCPVPEPENPPTGGSGSVPRQNPQDPNQVIPTNPTTPQPPQVPTEPGVGQITAAFSSPQTQKSLQNGQACFDLINDSVGQLDLTVWKISNSLSGSEVARFSTTNASFCTNQAGQFTVRQEVSNSEAFDVETKNSFLTATVEPVVPRPPVEPTPIIPEEPVLPENVLPSAPEEPIDSPGSDSEPEQVQVSEPVQSVLSTDPITDQEIKSIFNRLDSNPIRIIEASELQCPSLFDFSSPDRDSDRDGLSDAFEKAFGTDPNSASPFAAVNATLAQFNNCNPAQELAEIDESTTRFEDLQLNVKTNQLKVSTSGFVIPGSVVATQNVELQGGQVCFSAKDSDGFIFNLGCASAEFMQDPANPNLKVANFAFRNNRMLLPGPLTIVATAKTVEGKTIFDSVIAVIDPTLPVPEFGLISFAGKSISDLKTKQDGENTVYLAQVTKDEFEAIFATPTESGYAVEAYWNSVMISSAILADSSTGKTVVKVPEYVNLFKGATHKLTANLYSVFDPSVISETIQIEYELVDSKTNWLAYALIGLATILLLGKGISYYRKRQQI
jgi:hypothetical protein